MAAGDLHREGGMTQIHLLLLFHTLAPFTIHPLLLSMLNGILTKTPAENLPT